MATTTSPASPHRPPGVEGGVAERADPAAVVQHQELRAAARRVEPGDQRSRRAPVVAWAF